MEVSKDQKMVRETKRIKMKMTIRKETPQRKSKKMEIEKISHKRVKKDKVRMMKDKKIKRKIKSKRIVHMVANQAQQVMHFMMAQDIVQKKEILMTNRFYIDTPAKKFAKDTIMNSQRSSVKQQEFIYLMLVVLRFLANTNQKQLNKQRKDKLVKRIYWTYALFVLKLKQLRKAEKQEKNVKLVMRED